MLKAYKFRLYPNKEQEIQIQKTFGCARFVYNTLLDLKIKKYKNEKISMSKIDLNNHCNRVLKKEYEWLKEVDKFALTNSIYNMDSAYQKFFKEHSGYPKFKSKHNHNKSYKTNFANNNIEVNLENNKIKLPKLKWVNTKLHREFIGQIKSATISQVPSGKYYVSILVETEHISMKSTGTMVGIDLGIKDLLVTSDGEKINNIHTTKKYEKKLAREQRRLSRKGKGSKNRNKQRIKVARVHEKIANVRKDNLHKISHKIVSENQVIVSEDLRISNMMQNHKLAKAIADCSWYELTRQLEYKSKWNNRQYVKVDTYFPSSQICSCCGEKFPITKDLSVREWKCPNCHIKLDRDINASINILNEGLRILGIA